jgi:hypothetical protein
LSVAFAMALLAATASFSEVRRPPGTTRPWKSTRPSPALRGLLRIAAQTRSTRFGPCRRT